MSKDASNLLRTVSAFVNVYRDHARMVTPYEVYEQSFFKTDNLWTLTFYFSFNKNR